MEEFLNNITIVLVRPKYSSNIGSAARAMKNMGIKNLIAVSPRDYDYETALKLSTHASRDILDNMKIYESLNEALKDFNYCIGTTARLGRQRNLSIVTPDEMAKKVFALIQNNRIAILFGPEDKGLENEDLKSCHLLVNINTSQFSSLNLSQAVMVLCYEIFKKVSQPQKYYEPELATRFQLDSMYEHLKETLIKIDFIHPENPDHWIDNFRVFFSRFPMRAKEVNILRGVFRQINWYRTNMFDKGKKNKSS